MEKNSNIEKVLMAYLYDQANADEIKRLLEWLDQSPSNKTHFEVIQAFWKNSQYKVTVKGQEEVYKRIQEKIIQDNINDNRPKANNLQIIESKRKNSPFFSWGLAAAVFMLATVASIYFLKPSNQQSIQSGEVSSLIKSENIPGQKSKIILSDGTIVWLNSESKIEYPKQFDGSERLVRLQGEAFFEVAKDSLKPFKVASGNVTTVALGTSFNVQFFTEQELIITLVSGKVKVSFDNYEPHFLEPGNQLLYNRIDNSIEKKKVNVAHSIAWKNGILVFYKDGYDAVNKKLERWYGVNIKTTGIPPADFIITGQFSKNESLELTLETLSYGRQFQYEIHGKEIEIIFNN